MNRHEYRWTVTGRMYWSLRNTLGQFVTRQGFNRSRLAEQHTMWRAYLDARRDRAESDTRGHILTAQAWSRGISAARLFAPGASLSGASDELVDWFRTNGPTLSRAAFIAQCA